MRTVQGTSLAQDVRAYATAACVPARLTGPRGASKSLQGRGELVELKDSETSE
jgi:hypothetical protein